MKINMPKELEKSSTVGAVLIEIFSLLQQEKNLSFQETTDHLKSDADQVWDVQLLINGVGVPFRHFIGIFERGMEHAITKRANELLEEKGGELYEVFSRLVDDLKKRVSEETGIKEEG